MSNVIVVTFENETDASKARSVLRDLQKQNLLSMEDAAVIVKDAEGKIHVKNEMDRDVKIGAGIGGLLGVMLMFMFPIAGLAIGMASGALIGKLVDAGVDKKFVKDVTEALKPGSSGLIAIMNSFDATSLLSAMRPFEGGTLYETSLDPDLEQGLREARSDIQVDGGIMAEIPLHAKVECLDGPSWRVGDCDSGSQRRAV